MKKWLALFRRWCHLMFYLCLLSTKHRAQFQRMQIVRNRNGERRLMSDSKEWSCTCQKVFWTWRHDYGDGGRLL